MRPALLLVLVGCASPEVGFERDIAPIVQRECTGCHAGEAAEAGLDLLEDPWYALVDAPSVQSDYPLVAPGEALESYAWHKLNGTQVLAEGSGSNMPLGRWLDEAQIALVAEWIDLGAPE